MGRYSYLSRMSKLEDRETERFFWGTVKKRIEEKWKSLWVCETLSAWELYTLWVPQHEKREEEEDRISKETMVTNSPMLLPITIINLRLNDLGKGQVQGVGGEHNESMTVCDWQLKLLRSQKGHRSLAEVTELETNSPKRGLKMLVPWKIRIFILSFLEMQRGRTWQKKESIVAAERKWGNLQELPTCRKTQMAVKELEGNRAERPRVWIRITEWGQLVKGWRWRGWRWICTESISLHCEELGGSDFNIQTLGVHNSVHTRIADLCHMTACS